MALILKFSIIIPFYFTNVSSWSSSRTTTPEPINRWGPWVKPETYKDDDAFITFNCEGFLASKQLLSWYQIKRSETILLAIIQQEYSITRSRSDIALKKTLEPSDNGTEIYCALQNVLKGGNFTDVAMSRRIPIVFHKKIEPLETPFVTLKPNERTVYFDANTTLHFTCTGTKPVDGRRYTWFVKRPDSKLIIPMSQKYDRFTNENVLVLPVTESYHGYQLFCAQEFHYYINQTDGSLRRKKFGELVRSDIITLEWGREDRTTHILGLVLPILLVAIAAVIVGLLWLRRRRNQQNSSVDALVTDDQDDIYDSNYATARVTYAVLDLNQPEPADESTPEYAPIKPDARNYVKVIGVLKPNSDNRK